MYTTARNCKGFYGSTRLMAVVVGNTMPADAAAQTFRSDPTGDRVLAPFPPYNVRLPHAYDGLLDST